MLFVGLTGGIGAGKSTVANRLVELGAVLIDADRIARDVLEPGTPGLAAVTAEFGEDVLTPDGSLDRAALASRVFGDDAARERLNGIVHPLVSARSAELQAAAPPDAVLVQDIPLLVEGGMALAFPLVIVVHADAETRVRRLVDGRGMGEQDVRARIAAQATDEQRRAAADVWLDNSGTPDETRKLVDELWHERLRPFERGVREQQPAPRPPQPVLVPHDPAWPEQAARLCERIRVLAEQRVVRVDHVGSTAVPGLDAEDVLDIQVVTRDIETAQALAEELPAVGLVAQPAAWPDRGLDGSSWVKGLAVSADPGRAVNCYLRSADSPLWADVLLQRDWLRADDAARADYGAIKQRLAEHQADDRTGYAEAKIDLLHAASGRAQDWAQATGWAP